MEHFIKIPLHPRTSNNKWLTLSEWEEEIAKHLPTGLPVVKHCEVEVAFYSKFYSLMNIDKLVKPVLTALAKKNIIKTVGAVMRLEARKIKEEGEGSIRLRIKELSAEV